METLLLLADELGGSDCEAIGDGFLAQPVNALTSLGFVVAGMILAIRGLRSTADTRWLSVTYGSILVLVGFGSVAFHGPQPGGSQLMHDAPIAAAFLFILVFNLERLVDLPRPWLIGGLALALVTVLLAFAPIAGAVVSGLIAAAAFVSEFFVYRNARADRDGRTGRYLWLIGILLAALLGYWFGRTGSVICDPESLLQPHGLWHLLAAAAFAAWGFTKFPPQPSKGS